MAFMMSSDKPEKNVWAAASKVIKTRKPDQCSKRWKDALDPNIKHTPWTADEDATLAEAYGVYGTSWSEIRANCFPCRSNLELKNRCVEDVSGAALGHADPPLPALTTSHASHGGGKGRRASTPQSPLQAHRAPVGHHRRRTARTAAPPVRLLRPCQQRAPPSSTQRQHSHTRPPLPSGRTG